MKISDLEKKLKELRENYGDNEISFQVGDYYSRYGKDATMTGLQEGATFHDGTYTNDGLTRINLSLDTRYDGKHPNIVYKS